MKYNKRWSQVSSIQCHRIYITVSKSTGWYWGNTGPKQNWKPSGDLQILQVGCEMVYQMALPFRLCWLQHTCLSWAGSTPCQHPPLASIPWFWHLQCNPSFTIKASHIGLLGPPFSDVLLHARSQRLLLTVKEDSTTPLLYPSWLKSRTTWPKLPRFSACWGWNLALSLNYTCIRLTLLLRPRKSLRPVAINLPNAMTLEYASLCWGDSQT